jgi:hypothetical protein
MHYRGVPSADERGGGYKKSGKVTMMVKHDLSLESENLESKHLKLKVVSGNLKSVNGNLKSANVKSNPKEGMPRMGLANEQSKSANKKSNSNEVVEGRRSTRNL